MLNLFRFIGLRHLQFRPVRTLLTTLGVALGIALYVAISTINRSTLASFKESVNAVAGKATLIVAAGEAGFPESKLEKISKVIGVKHVAPVIESRAYFAGAKESSETMVILGVDLLREQNVRTYKTTDEQIIDDPLVFLNQPDSIIVTHSFAAAHNLRIDSTFRLATTDGMRQFTVRGMLSPEGPAKAYGGSIAIMDIDGARQIFGKIDKVDRADIITREDENVGVVAERIRRTLGPGYSVDRPETQSENMERMVRSFQMMLSFFSTLALLVGVFLVTNSIGMSVAERKREIGTLRALGATRRGILLLFLSEALAMGIAGGVIGVGLGRALASSLVEMIARAMSSQYLTKIEVTRLVFDSKTILHAVLLGGSAAVVAALWPSYMAGRIQPLEAMKNRESSGSGPQQGFFRYTHYIGTALLLYLAISSKLHWAERHAALDALNQVSAMVGAALVGPSIVSMFVRSFRKVIQPLGGTVTRLAQDNLLRNPKRTGSNVMSLMVGLMLVILISSVNASFKATIVDWFDKILRADLLVSSNGRMISYQVQPLHEDLSKELAKIPGVELETDNSRVGGLRFVHIRYQDRQLGMKAFDEGKPELKHSNFVLLDRRAEDAGNELFRSPNPVIFVSENFVLHFKKKTGDIIDIDTPSGLMRARIIGVVSDFASPEGVIYISRNLYKKFWKDPLVSAFGILVKPGFDPMMVRQEIDRRFGKAKNLMVISNAELKAQMLQTIDQSFAYTRAIEGAALLVGLLGLFNTLLISVLERTRELGTLRAVGMSRPQMGRMIIQEAILQGGFGALAAVALGSWIAYLWISNTLAHALGWIVGFHFPWTGTITTILVGTGVALIGGAYPAYRAANLEIREALEYE